MPLEKLDLLILKTLELAPLHGYGIGQRIEQTSGGVFRITLGALYPALQRLERTGMVRAEWNVSENNRRARYYKITAKGQKSLANERRNWERFMKAMEQAAGLGAGVVFQCLQQVLAQGGEGGVSHRGSALPAARSRRSGWSWGESSRRCARHNPGERAPAACVCHPPACPSDLGPSP